MNEKIEHISNLRDTLIDVYKANPEERVGYPTTRWGAFNDAFGGFQPGRLFIVTGDTGSGKTTWTTNWLMDAVQQGHKSFVISLEDPWEDTAERLAVMISETPLAKMESLDVGGVLQVFSGMPLWYFDWTGRVKQKHLFRVIKDAVVEKGVRFIVLDNMDYVAYTQGKDTSSESIRDFMCDLNGLCQELKACVLAVVHPSKLSNKGVGRREVGMDELKGSSSLKQVAHAVMSVFQPKQSSTEMAVRFQKIKAMRYSASTGGVIRFSFNPETQWYSELSRYLQWGSYDEEGNFQSKGV